MSPQKKPLVPADGDHVEAPVVDGAGVRFGEVTALLALAVSSEPAPSPEVQDRLLARIRAAKSAGPTAAPAEPGWRFESAEAAEGWRSAPFAGVRVKTLSVDEERDSVLLLMEMAPGARIPDHRHDGPEEGLLISGDVLNGGRLMRPGDYYRADDQTMHVGTVSPSGCLALVNLNLRSWRAWRGVLGP